MLKEIVNKKIQIAVSEEKVVLPQEIQEKIEEHWEKVISQTPDLWNGEIMCVSKYHETENEIQIICKKSNYAHYLYDERIGLPLQYACSSMVAGCLLETSDGYYVVGELAPNTSYPFCMQISGGNADKQDIEDGKMNILKTIQREVREEVNIDINDTKQVEQYQIKYMELPEGNRHVYMVFAKGKLLMTAEQMKEYYKEYLEYLKKNQLEIEFGKLHFIKKENGEEELKKLKNPKREYLEKLLQEDSMNG